MKKSQDRIKAVTASEGLKRGREPAGDDVRAKVRGVNVGYDGTEYPRVSWRDYHQVVSSADQESDFALLSLLGRFCRPGSVAWKNFASVRMGTRRERDDGYGDYEITKTDVPRHMPPWEEHKLARERARKTKDGVKEKVYTLAQVLSDSYVREKYDMPEKFVRSIATMAVTRPADAAATVKEYLEYKSPNANVRFRVLAGAYAASASAACRDIAMMASTVPAAQLGVPATVVADSFFMHDKTDDVEWSVKGPLKYAAAVSHIHRLAAHGGVHAPIHLFGLETIKLGIDITYGGKVVSSTVIGHARDSGDLRFLRNSGTLDELSSVAKLRFERLKGNILPLLEDGKHYASAVRLGDKVVVVNQHVIEEMHKPSVGGKPLVTRQVLVDDLWAYVNAGASQQWNYREPVIGEMACIMYHSGAEVLLSSMFPVQACDGASILSKLVDGVVQGMSGGAVVAVNDFSLLGVHRGQNQVKLQAMRVTRTAYEDLCDFVSDSQSAEAQSVTRVTSGIEETIVTRGLYSNLSGALESLVAVYDGARHEGTAVVVDDCLLSSSFGTKKLYVDGGTQMVDFAPREGSVLQGSDALGLPSLKTLRLPQLGESVVLVGKDAEGPVVSSCRVVKSVGPFRRSFFLDFEKTEYNIDGAIVFSLGDGAVLGTVVRVAERQAGFFCVTFPKEETEGMVRVDTLARMLPRMGVDTWDVAHVDAALDVDRSDNAWTVMGRVQLQLAVYRALERLKVPVEHWGTEFERLVSPPRLAALAQRLDMVKLLASESDGYVPTDRVVANCVVALVGVMFKYETVRQVDAWLEMAHVIDFGSRARPSGMLRRSSGFAVLAEDGHELSVCDA